MAYDTAKLASLSALKALAERTDKDFAKKTTVNGLSARVGGLTATSDAFLNGMYQQPQAAQLRTKGALNTDGTGAVIDQTLGDLMDGKLNDDFAVKDGEGAFVLDSESRKQYDFIINGVKTGTYTEDTTLSTILSDIDSNRDAGVQTDYSQTTQCFTFTARTAGADSKIELGNGLASAMFSGVASDQFADVYNISLAADESKKFYFESSVLSSGFRVTGSTSAEHIASELNETWRYHGCIASFDKTLGKLVVTDGAGNTQEVVVLDGVSDETISPKSTSSYTSGQDAIFTAVKVNGETQATTDKAVNIAVPVKISDLDNDVQFQTSAEVAAAIQAAVSESGKGLSTNDYTDEDKAKLAGIQIAADNEIAEMLNEVFGASVS